MNLEVIILKIRLGLIGAADSLTFVQTIIDTYPEFICTPIECITVDDLEQKVVPVLDQMDMWLCMGPITYNIVLEWNKIDAPIFYIAYKGSTLYKTILRVLYEQQINVDEISFDSIDVATWEQALVEAGITTKIKYVESEMISLDGLTQYHYELWKSGKTKAAITGHPIHQELSRLGVPAYRNLPSSMAVETVLVSILRTYEMLQYKSSQIAVQIVEIDSFQGLKRDSFSTDELVRMELKYTETLLSYTKKILGSVKPSGFGRYVIFTTRGLLQDMTEDFTNVPHMEDLSPLSNEAVTCGIGIGQTVYDAEINAGNALIHAKEYGKGVWMVCFDDKKISGPLGTPEQLMYSYASDHLQSVSQKTGFSVSTLNKLNATLKKLPSNEANAQELAKYMKIPERSARRILTTLEEEGYAKVVATEKPHTRGRPRKIYTISLT